jgi:hypothetical protein
MRSRQNVVAVTVLLSLLCLASAGGSVLGTPTPTQTATPTEGAPTHTLVITAQTGSGGSYTVTASTELQLKHGEQRDYQLRGPRVSGTVGERGDSRDVIRYRGHIESFQADGSIRVTLDGRQIAPRVLGGQYIQIRRAGTATQSVRYQFGVTGQVSRGALAEQNDTVTGGQIHGRVRDTADSFYFTGTILNDSITISGPATVMINGQPAEVYLTHEPPTPTATPTPSSPSPTVSSTGEPTPPPASDQSPTASSSPKSSPSPSSPSSSGVIEGEFVLGLAGGLLLILVCGALLALLQ